MNDIARRFVCRFLRGCVFFILLGKCKYTTPKCTWAVRKHKYSLTHSDKVHPLATPWGRMPGRTPLGPWMFPDVLFHPHPHPGLVVWVQTCQVDTDNLRIIKAFSPLLSGSHCCHWEVQCHVYSRLLFFTIYFKYLFLCILFVCLFGCSGLSCGTQDLLS